MIKRNPVKQRKRTMRKKNRILDKKMQIPGLDFYAKLIPGDTPLVDGVYMVYYIPNPPLTYSHIKSTAGITIANYADGSWRLSERVVAYAGPIPSLELDPLEKFTPPYLNAHTFFISTLEDAAKGYYRLGPFPQFMLAFLKPGKEGEFIFYLNSDNNGKLVVLSRYGQRKDGAYTWKDLSEKASKKYCKRMEMLEK